MEDSGEGAVGTARVRLKVNVLRPFESLCDSPTSELYIGDKDKDGPALEAGNLAAVHLKSPF